MEFRKADSAPTPRRTLPRAELYEQLETGDPIEVTVVDAAEGIPLDNTLRQAAHSRGLKPVLEWRGNTLLVQWVKR